MSAWAELVVKKTEKKILAPPSRISDGSFMKIHQRIGNLLVKLPSGSRAFLGVRKPIILS